MQLHGGGSDMTIDERSSLTRGAPDAANLPAFVAWWFFVDPEALVGPTRASPAREARAVLAAELHRRGYSLSNIGRWLHRAKGTAGGLIQRGEMLLEQMPTLASELQLGRGAAGRDDRSYLHILTRTATGTTETIATRRCPSGLCPERPQRAGVEVIIHTAVARVRPEFAPSSLTAPRDEVVPTGGIVTGSGFHINATEREASPEFPDGTFIVILRPSSELEIIDGMTRGAVGK